MVYVNYVRMSWEMRVSELKPGWTRVRFGDIAECVNDRVDDPSTAGVERYVGLEHLDSESLKIRRWGAPEDVESTKLRFQIGDIIFGKRRAYQRKLAVADFEGICSAHAMVLRAKRSAIDPQFLPFFMQGDVFMERAQQISVGSLSPTINWKTLAVQEFLMPDEDGQRRIRRLLLASSALLEETDRLRIAAKTVTIAHRDQSIENLVATCEVAALGTLLSEPPRNGCSAHERDQETGHWVLSLSALSAHGFVADQVKVVDTSAPMRAALLVDGDLLISRSNTRERVGFVGRFIADNRQTSYPDTMMRLKPKTERVSSEYLEMALQSNAIRAAIQTSAAGTSASMKKINQGSLGRILIPVPTNKIQERIVATGRDLGKSLNETILRVSETRSLHTELANRCFEP